MLTFYTVPWVEIVIENNDTFLNTDPYVEGRNWVINAPWDELYLGKYIFLLFIGSTPPLSFADS